MSKFSASLKTETSQWTLGYYLLFICLGLGMAVTGPTLPSLAEQTHSSLGSMGLLFLAGSIGYTLGTVVGGRIFDRVRGHPVLGAAQLAAAALLILMPLLPWFPVLLAVAACKGLADGLINTGANTLLVWTHGEKVGPYMNGLHFFFGLGAFLSPILVAQFTNITGGYRWVYWILSGLAALVGLRMLTVKTSPRLEHHQSKKKSNASGNGIYYPLVFSAMLFLFFYVGSEITFGGWIYTYAVTLNLASAAGAAYLNSGFWVSFTIGRLLSIPAATRFTPKQIILTALLGCLSILFLAIILPDSGSVLWIVALGLGFCMAPIWPTGFALAGQSLKLTARLSAIILLGDSLGGMILPWLVGQMIDATGPRAMIFLVFGSLIFNLLAFLGLLRMRQMRVERGCKFEK